MPDEATLKLVKKLPNNPHARNLVKEYGPEKALEIYSIWKNERYSKKSSASKEGFILRHGEEEGLIKYQKSVKRRSNANKGKSYSTIEAYIQKFGSKEGIQRYNARCEKIRWSNSLEGYKSKFGEEEGNKKYEAYKSKISDTMKEHNYFPKNHLIKKYGKKKGIIEFKKCSKISGQKRKGKCCNTLSNFIRLYGDDEGPRHFQKMWKKRAIANKNTFSKISQDLFWLICKSLSEEEMNEVNFSEHNGEFIYHLTEDDKNLIENKMHEIFMLDFKFKNKIIEFNGTYWHAITQKEDIVRYEILKRNNFQILVIEEKDFNHKNKSEEIVQKCIDFLKS